MKKIINLAIENAIRTAVENGNDDAAIRATLLVNGINPDAIICEDERVIKGDYSPFQFELRFDLTDNNGHKTATIVDLDEGKVCYKDLDTVGAEYGDWWDIPTESDEVGDLHYFIAEREAWIEEENDRINASDDEDEISWSKQLISNWKEEIERAYSSLENYDKAGNLVG